MRALIQRVQEASVDCDDGFESRIGHGYLILLGVGVEADENICDRLRQKIKKLQLYKDDKAKKT